MKHVNAKQIMTIAAAAMLATACGGGSGGDTAVVNTDPPVAGTEVPVSATTSSAGAMAFMKSLAATSDNTANPIVVGDAVLATSDTDEPEAGI
jgi:hypothetical protein